MKTQIPLHRFILLGRRTFGQRLSKIGFSSFLILAQFLQGPVASASRPRQPNQFPTQGWSTARLEQVGIDRNAFKNLRDYVFDTRAKYKTDAFLIIKDGKLVYEEYGNGYGPDQPHMLWSFSKGLVNALLGVAEHKGLLHRNTLVHQYYPQFAKTRQGQSLTLQHLMHMSSGLDYYEEHPANIILSDSISINYTADAYTDMAENMSRRSFVAEPGTKFNYSSGECNLAMGVLKKVLGRQDVYDRFPWMSLFNILGMRSTTFEQDASGTFVGGSFGWSSARDIAKLGYLYLNDGVWDGERLFPRDWVKWSLTTAPALQNPQLVQSDQLRLNQEDYGAYWWLNKKLPMNREKPFPAAPEDTFLAMGYKGQTLAVIPSKKTIIVRLGNDGLDSETKLNRAHMLALYMETLKPASQQTHLAVPPEAKYEAYEMGGLLGSATTLVGLFELNTRLDDGIVMAPAKDVCSCIFVVGKDPQFCMDNHEQYQLFRNIGIFDGWIRPLRVDFANQTVTAENRNHLTVAQRVSPELGCQIVRFRHKIFGQERFPARPRDASVRY